MKTNLEILSEFFKREITKEYFDKYAQEEYFDDYAPISLYELDQVMDKARLAQMDKIKEITDNVFNTNNPKS